VNGSAVSRSAPQAGAGDIDDQVMSLENARAIYPILIQAARDLSDSAKERRNTSWLSYDDLCLRCKELGINETPRTVLARLLKPLQMACLENGLPDLSALVIQKPKSRNEFGFHLRTSDGWWTPYVEKGEATAGDVVFWFRQYQAARDYADWPETPFF